MTKKQKKMLARILAAAALFLAAELIPLRAVSTVLFFAAYFTVGWDILLDAWHGIRNRQVFDENFLMAVATVGAIALAVYEKSGDYAEAVAVMLFYQIGELFQSCAVGKSRRSITALMDIRPDYANIERDGALVQVSPDEVPVGSTIVVLPGERIPIDGVVEEGSASLDTAALTGESLPRDVSVGDEVSSGCVDLTSVLRLRTTKEFGESTVSKILELMESSGAHKSRSESFITRFARIYTPAVCYSALALAVLPPLVSLLAGSTADRGTWLYRALTFLVVSCPCALVISIPLSFFAGLGGASREGVLIKGSNYLEALSETKTVVFDKTGTLTRGVFEVTDIRCAAMDEEKLLEYAALAECASPHPISKSLRRACGKELDLSRVADIRELSGRGVTATVDSLPVAVGNTKLMDDLGVEWQDSDSVGTVVHIAVNGSYAGHFVISDLEKPTSREAIGALRRVGVTKTVMLTGDSERVAAQVAQQLGLDEHRASLLPADKVSEVEKLLAMQPKGAKLAFVGDGINDAPVLSRADIGIAMGAMGSDAAIEAADIVLMDDDPLKLVRAIKISRKCLRIVRENIVFSIAVKFACLALIAFGHANMWMGIFADVGVMVLAVLNAIRALRVR